LAEALQQSVHDVVSSESDMLVLVDERDREVGTLSKADCHSGAGVLHRAFSLFVFDGAGKLLLQRRGPDKRLWPGFWSNSCCSHPRAGETMEQATHRRLLEELGMRSPLRYLYKFRYHARYGEAGSERELCWVYAGVSDAEVRANANEISDWRWVTHDQLDSEIAQGPDAFTPWFRLEWPRVRRLCRAELRLGGGE
jgi:isopentenyl-diphosphate delta-isomerase